jgi:hypothetical protein
MEQLSDRQRAAGELRDEELEKATGGVGTPAQANMTVQSKDS